MVTIKIGKQAHPVILSAAKDLARAQRRASAARLLLRSDELAASSHRQIRALRSG